MNDAKNSRKIEQLGSPALRQIALPVERLDAPEIKATIAAMQTTLSGTQGVGLAAPQIGESLRIIIVASRPTPRYPSAPAMEPTVMINPSFIKLSEEKIKDWEGCLSVPGIRALVPRYRKITLNYLDCSGQPQEQIIEDFVARVFQHEYDHLDGKVYLDRVESNLDIVSEQEYLKLTTLNLT